MAKGCGHSISGFINSYLPRLSSKPTKNLINAHKIFLPISKLESSFGKDEIPQYVKKRGKRNSRGSRKLITISTSEARWHGQWTSDYAFTLQELQLSDLAEDGNQDALVYVTLNIYKHAGFGFSVNGKVSTSFVRKCSNCLSSYRKPIEASLNVWVLPSSRGDRELQLPEIDGDDPSVIYVKPGTEADLDSLIQDTVRLASAVKGTCSDLCEKSPTKWHYNRGEVDSVDKRWSVLLEMKKKIK